MVSVTVRCVAVLAAAVNVTEPLAVPAAPEVIVSQAALLVATQAQPVVVVTVIAVPAPPLFPTV
jgi:hypothetical protein